MRQRAMASRTLRCCQVIQRLTPFQEGLSCTADDVGHLQRRPVHACVFSFSVERERIQRTGRRAEMLLERCR